MKPRLMKLFHAILFLVLALSEAKTSMRRAPKEGQLKALQLQVSPEVGGSSEKFFKKDYPNDKRPSAEALHFKHPYPVVQDSNDFDKDFVKDENSDNGSFKAQETYDRLRVKLRKEKKDLAKALAKKEGDEKELQEAIKKHQEEERREQAAKELAAREAAKAAQEEQEKKRQEAVEEAKKAAEKIIPQAVKEIFDKKEPAVKDVEVSTEDTEKAMKHLQDCKKELAEARQKLKDVMKELEEAKAVSSAANKKLDAAVAQEASEKATASTLTKNTESEYKEYMEAKQSYDKQQGEVEKLEHDIKIAASKVKAIRDSADADGGVYPKKAQKSAALGSSAWVWPTMVLAVAALVR